MYLYRFDFEWTRPKKRSFSVTDEHKIFDKIENNYWLSDNQKAIFIQSSDPKFQILPIDLLSLGITIVNTTRIVIKEEINANRDILKDLYHLIEFIIAIFILVVFAPIKYYYKFTNLLQRT
jgi:hypothetical protein